MTHMRYLAGLAAILMTLAGCAGETALPEATGKGTVRAINAIKGSPAVRFLIEERALDAVSYKSESAGRQWDDFEYNFNFDATLAGDIQPTRIATELLKVDADRDYTLVVTGSVTAPTVLVWEGDRPAFGDGDTTFQGRLAHLAPALGSLDFYFDAPGIEPVTGAARGTLAYGEILPPIESEAGDYVLTVTAAGDPSDIVYQSGTIRYAEQSAFVIPLFEGDALDVAPYTARSFSLSGGALAMPDNRFPPVVRLFQADIDLAVADVYTDEMLTELLVADHAFGDITGDLPTEVGGSTFYYTPAGNTGAVLFEGQLQATAAGSRNNVILFNTGSTRSALAYAPDRRSVSTVARLTALNAASNHEFIDVYVVDSGAGFEEATRRAVLGLGLPPSTVELQAGNYDVYLTVAQEETIITGPVSLTVALGDVVESIVLDVTDPSAAEFRVVPPP